MAKILVVDDEIEICEFLKEFFSDRGYIVNSALSAEEALISIENDTPDIVLLDMKMSGMDGLEALEIIKKRWPKVKVIMVTAVESSDKIEDAFALGADNYIVKPLSLEYLDSEVRNKINDLT